MCLTVTVKTIMEKTRAFFIALAVRRLRLNHDDNERVTTETYDTDNQGWCFSLLKQNAKAKASLKADLLSGRLV